jgi:hypothetical protein
MGKDTQRLSKTISIASVEKKMEVPQKTKNKSTI